MQIPEERTKDGAYVQKGTKPVLYLSNSSGGQHVRHGVAGAELQHACTALTTHEERSSPQHFRGSVQA